MKIGIDVVIPTYDGKKLYNTIEFLNKGNLKPANIFCVFHKKFSLDKYRKFSNLKFIHSNLKGQVRQRNIGFKKCKSEIILQLDDDVLLQKKTLKTMYNLKKTLGKKYLIGPKYLDKNNKFLYHDVSKEGLFKNIYKFLICASPLGKKKSGKITSLTLAYGTEQSNKTYSVSDWIPGGCVMFSKNLLLENFLNYDFKGKAYCEDIFFSIQQKNKGYKHVICNKSIAIGEVDNAKITLKDFCNEISVRKYLLRFTDGNIIRFYIWVIFEFFLRFSKF